MSITFPTISQESAEFVRIFNGYRQDLLDKTKKTSKQHELSGLQAPSSVDWRAKGVVTPVKNQVCDTSGEYLF